MTKVGIIRRIDDLGKIIIPRQIRQLLRIKEGCPFEILVEENGNIILKKIDIEKSLIDDVLSLEEKLYIYNGSLELEDIDCIRDAIKIIKGHIKIDN